MIPQTTTGLGKLAPGPGHLGMRDQPVRQPAAGEVTLQVIAAGICGTDLHIADDEFPSNPPVTMGHEVTGEVAALGEGVDESWMGARVAVETYFYYCERCQYCRNGRPNLCSQRRSIGSHVDGGFAEWLTLPARNLHRLPDSVGRHAGALTEPLACVAQILFDPPLLSSGDRVLVVGPGTMGMLTAQSVRAAGGEVILVGLERDRARLDIAADLGFEARVVGDPGVGDGFDAVCECSGAAAGGAMALDAVRKGGRYIQVGIYGNPVTIDIDQVLYKEVTYTSGFASTPASWERAMRLLEGGAVDLDRLVSEVVPLPDWENAFAATRAGEGMKFVLNPRIAQGESP
jgi:L-iditol 2-dehydrogenase